MLVIYTFQNAIILHNFFVHSSIICLPEKVTKWLQHRFLSANLQVTILGQLFTGLKNCFEVILSLKNMSIFRFQCSKIYVIHVNLWYANILQLLQLVEAPHVMCMEVTILSVPRHDPHSLFWWALWHLSVIFVPKDHVVWKFLFF